MKTLTVVLVLAVIVIHVSGYMIQIPTAPSVQPKELVTIQWLQIQKFLTPLFDNVCEENNELFKSNGITIKSGDFLIPDAVTNLEKLIAAGLVPKGEIFSEYNPQHMKELKIIYELLSSARHFEAFYQAAIWARLNLNCGLYVNAIYMAIQSRRDTERLSIPPPYEVLPNYFVRKDVLFKASSILAGQDTTPVEGLRSEGNTYFMDANYTAMFYDNDDESKLAYFREDIGLNSYYFLRKLRLSPWLNDDINSRYGEHMYQMMKQFMARYNLERYANGLPEVDGIDWTSLPDVPYDPELVYSDGKDFPHRTAPLEIPVNEDISLLQTIENNIETVVSHMRQSGYNKTQILNHLMEILVTGERSYETLARQLLGKDHTNNGHASVLEHYMTSLRDPMFWKINKKIVDLVDSALKMLPTYSRNELYFPGVEVVNIDVKKMMTAYDYFEFDVTDALKLDDSKSTFNVKIGQPRLNHKPFTVKVNISSLVAKKGLVKIYLGPKLMPGELAMKKNLFTLLDVFEVNLKIGANIISRSSGEMKHFSSDFMSLKTIRKKIEDAEFGLDSLPLQTIESQIGYPTRLILPKGLPQGLPIQMFVFVAPFTKAGIINSYSSTMEFNTAILSPGYPLDLIVEDRQLFALPNALIKYVTITQKGDSKVENYGGPGVTKQWYGTNNYDPSSRPNYQNNKKPFDYKAKKEQPVDMENNADTLNEYPTTTEESFNYPSVLPLQEDYNRNVVLDDSISDENTVRSLNSMKYDKNIENKDKNEKKEYFSKENYNTLIPEDNASDVKKQDKLIEVAPILLKLVNYDYSSNSQGREPFDYKSKKAQYDKKDYSAKRGNYTKYRTVTPKEEVITTSTISTLEPKDEFVRVQLDKDTNNEGLISDIKTATSPEEESTNSSVTTALVSEFAVNADENQNIITPRLLKSSKFDDSMKRKEPFDYKAKKAQFNKKDYSTKRGNYTKYRTVTPKEEVTTPSTLSTQVPKDEFARVQLDKDINNKDLISEIKGNDVNVNENADFVEANDIVQSKLVDMEPLPLIKPSQLDKYDYDLGLDSEIKNLNVFENEDTAQKDDAVRRNDVIDIVPFSIPFSYDVEKRTPSVYDFLFHTFDYEDKVYE